MMQFRKKKNTISGAAWTLWHWKRAFSQTKKPTTNSIGVVGLISQDLCFPCFNKLGSPRATFSAQQCWGTDTQQDTSWAGQLAMKAHLLMHLLSSDIPVSAKWEGNLRSLLFSGACREALWAGCTPSPVTQGS